MPECESNRRLRGERLQEPYGRSGILPARSPTQGLAQASRGDAGFEGRRLEEEVPESRHDDARRRPRRFQCHVEASNRGEGQASGPNGLSRWNGARSFISREVQDAVAL